MQVKLLQILEDVSGNSNGNDWRRVKVLTETFGEYSRKIAFDCKTKAVSDQMAGIPIGSTIEIEYEPHSREWQGKWYSDHKVWKVSVVGQATSGTTASAPIQPNPAAMDSNTADDLPF